MVGDWNGNEIILRVPADTRPAVLVVMFNPGWEKQVEVFEEGIVDPIHRILSTDNRPTPATRILRVGQTYYIRPAYFRQAGDLPQSAFNTVQQYHDDVAPNAGSVSHRNFRVNNAGGSEQKISITIVLVDDDVSPGGKEDRSKIDEVEPAVIPRERVRLSVNP